MNCMATLKHIASKNSDYAAIEAYLVYQHDAFTGKQLLDEQGKPKLRESYLLDTLECGDFSFATACLLANRKYGKNTQHDDMINLKIDPEFQSQIPPLTDDEFKQLEENILKEGKLLSPLIVWNNTLVDGHNRYEIVQEHPEISFSTMPLPFESREDVLAWICKNQLGRRNLTPEQKKFLIGKQYSVEHRKPGGNGNNQHTAAAKKTAPEELCQIDTIPPTAAEASVRKQIAERNNVSESYVARSEKFMRGVEIMEQMVPGMQEKILSGQFKVRDADMHRLARADFPNRKQIVHEILHPEDRSASQSSYSHYSGINYSALEAAVRRIQQDVDFLMRYLPKVPDDAYVKVETTKILKQHKAYMAQFEEMLNDEKIA